MIETCSHHDIAELETLIAHLVFNLTSKFHRKISFGAPEFIPGILWSKCCLIFSFLCFFFSRLLFFILSFSFGHCVVCPSIYWFWLPLSVSSNTFYMFFYIFIRVISLLDGILVLILCQSNIKDKEFFFLNCRYLNLAKNSENNFIEIKYSQVVTPFKFYTK